MARNFSMIRKAILQLPPAETIHFAIYKFQKALGIYQLRTPLNGKEKVEDETAFTPRWFTFWSDAQFTGEQISHKDKIIKRADEIISGKINFFDSISGSLDLDPQVPLVHWSKSQDKKNRATFEDVKFTWEPARFSWAIHLSQAFWLTKDEKYASYFLKKFEEFSISNPINRGPNWESAQEIALRLIALTIALNLSKDSKSLSNDNIKKICFNIAQHANRIPPTVCYAKAQNNNHIISEAVGLYTAGSFLSQHPDAAKWKTIGKKLFEQFIKKQIDENGEYIQHSTNYHRLMLTLAVWMNKLLIENDDSLQQETIIALRKATLWLYEMMDRISGQVPNLGHNDGSNFLPFSTSAYADYRPVIQAAALTFLNVPLLENINDDALSNWLNIASIKEKGCINLPDIEIPRIGDDDSWALLRAKHYKSRPAHADQLHVDLWYQGINILRDAGTFSYNAPPPWDNSLAATRVHNTVTIDSNDQMARAGRFLWLDWSRGHIPYHSGNRITGAHDGYLPFGLVHERQLSKITDKHWKVVDILHKLKTAKQEMNICIHWLLPDWKFINNELNTTIEAPFGKIHISHQISPKSSNASMSFYKGGNLLSPSGKEDILLGWYSPTYGLKQPALSMVLNVYKKLPVEITTDIIFE